MLRRLTGNVDVPGLSGGLLNDGDSTKEGIASAMMIIPADMCRYLSDQPGCKLSNCGIGNIKTNALHYDRSVTMR